MNLGVRTILLLVAVVLFILGVFAEENFDELLTIGLAAFAGAFLSDAMGFADRTFNTPRRDTT